MKKIKIKGRAFSLIELSVVVLIIGVIIAAVIGGRKMVTLSNLTKARTLTNSSPVAGIEDLALWLEPTSTKSFTVTKPTDGAALDTWRDINPQLTVKKDALQPTGGNQPHYIESAINGLPAIRFNGISNEEYFTINTSSTDSTLSAPQTIFIVFNQKANDRSVITKGLLSRASYSDIDWEVQGTGGGIGFNYTAVPAANDISTIEVGTTIHDTGKNFILSVQWDKSTTANAASFYMNGALQNQATATAGTVVNNVWPLYIGGKSGASFYGDIGEVIIFNRSLSDFERGQVQSYLSKKWGITLS